MLSIGSKKILCKKKRCKWCSWNEDEEAFLIAEREKSLFDNTHANYLSQESSMKKKSSMRPETWQDTPDSQRLQVPSTHHMRPKEPAGGLMSKWLTHQTAECDEPWHGMEPLGRLTSVARHAHLEVPEGASVWCPPCGPEGNQQEGIAIPHPPPCSPLVNVL